MRWAAEVSRWSWTIRCWAVSSRPQAMAYDVSAVNGRIIENKIVPDYLGSE
ncbi:hypothetical protein [Paenibacillus humicola]|uniref:hypothetical protein n=1 Tax=Paenibacillus humicola TaxID=3110540 RepID=UPI00237AE556|nr:hypothetical protein [Paenibacillus humicola]